MVLGIVSIPIVILLFHGGAGEVGLVAIGLGITAIMRGQTIRSVHQARAWPWPGIITTASVAILLARQSACYAWLCVSRIDDA